MIELQKALEIMHHTLDNRTTPAETIPTQNASGRVLARDVLSEIDQPPFDKSAMDGFAIPAGDMGNTFNIIETVQAGAVPEHRLKNGFCTRIMTGAPVPENTGRVVQVEHTETENNLMRITRQSSAKNICMKAEDIVAGQPIAQVGTRLNSLNLSVLISCGIHKVEVYRQPRVTVFSTGDELVNNMDEWGPGKIFDSNGPMMCELMREAGANIIKVDHLPDDPGITQEKLAQSIENNDIIAFSGGVSAGKFDFIPASLEECGLEIHFSRLLVKPGKPMTYATDKNTAVFGFPGNPVSTWLMFHLLALPALNRLQGLHLKQRYLQLPLKVDWKRKKSERLEFIPAELSINTDNITSINPLKYHGSAHLSALQSADGMAIVKPGIKELAAGEIIDFWPLTMKSYTGAIL